MSCNGASRRCANAARQNGISGQLNRYLNTLGNWSTWRDVDSVEAVPGRLAELTTAFFGLKGLLEGRPQLAGLLGGIIAVHALEQVTAATATMGVRAFGRGRPLGKYRGLIIHQNPFTERKAALLRRLSRGRLREAAGYYFHEGGRTWRCESFTIELNGAPRSLTHVRSLSIPHREHFFDRPLTLTEADPHPIGDDTAARSVPIQRVIDVIMGDENPEQIPGYLGGTNEFENAVGSLGYLKRAFYTANWLLVDESERDAPLAGAVDYRALIEGRAPGSQGQPVKIKTGSSGAGGSPVYPSTSTPIPVLRARSTPDMSAGPAVVQARPVGQQAYGRHLFNTTGNYNPNQTVEVEGQARLLAIRRLMTDPFSGKRRAEAAYYDPGLGQWRLVDDNEAREQIAREVEAGRMGLTDWPL